MLFKLPFDVEVAEKIWNVIYCSPLTLNTRRGGSGMQPQIVPVREANHVPRFNSNHSSLLRTFGLSATSTNDSYLRLLFGKFALIWGHFQNVSVCRFRGRWGRWGQTTSKSKTTKILNENLLKLDEIQNLASATLKMTSWPLRPRKRLSEFFQKLHF